MKAHAGTVVDRNRSNLRFTDVDMPRIFVFALTALLSVAPVYDQSSTPNGVWLHPNKRIQVEIAPCGATLCGKIVWFSLAE